MSTSPPPPPIPAAAAAEDSKKGRRQTSEGAEAQEDIMTTENNQLEEGQGAVVQTSSSVISSYETLLSTIDEAEEDGAARKVLRHLVDTRILSVDDLEEAVKTTLLSSGGDIRACANDNNEQHDNGRNSGVIAAAVGKSTSSREETSKKGDISKVTGESSEAKTAGLQRERVGGGKRSKKKMKKEDKKQELFSRCRWRHVAIRIWYDGSSYCGFSSSSGVMAGEDDINDNNGGRGSLSSTTGVNDEVPSSSRSADGANTTVGGRNGAAASKTTAATTTLRAVEDDLFQALRKTCLVRSRAECNYSRCGRTDSGVSAFGQVIALHLRSRIPRDDDDDDADDDESLSSHRRQPQELPKNSWETVPIARRHTTDKGQKKTGSSSSSLGQDPILMTEYDYCKMLNSSLPPTIRALGWSPVTPNFSARFSALDRTYRYFFVRRQLDMNAMQRGLDYVVGNHDFRNLCKMDTESVYNFTRFVKRARIVIPEKKQQVDDEEEGVMMGRATTENKTQSGGGDTTTTTKEDTGMVVDSGVLTSGGIVVNCVNDIDRQQVCHFEIQGQAFLWHMVRCIVAVSFLVGQRQEKPEVFTELFDIDANPRKPSYTMAPDLPLVLHGCDYTNLTLGYSTANLWAVTGHLESKWEELALAAQRVRDALDSLKVEAYVQVGDLCQFAKEALLSPKKGRRRRGGDKTRNKKGQQSQDVAEEGSGTTDGNDPKSAEEWLDWLEKESGRHAKSSKTQCAGDSSERCMDAKTDDQHGLDDSASTTTASDQGRRGNDDGGARAIVSWKRALHCLSQMGYYPVILPSSSTTSGGRQQGVPQYQPAPSSSPAFYVPLMERPKAPTYEEKVENMKGRKRARYEENMQKIQTVETDKSFYEGMAKEGGSGI